MNNEIKEILDTLKEEIDLKPLWYSERIILLDYITNLQEENKELNLELKGYRQAILNDDNLMGLKLKIEKAINYIEIGKTFDNENIRKTIDKIQKDLLDILKGDPND